MPPRRSTRPRSPSHMALGEAIEELRREAGLTHEALGDRIGLSASRIGQFERGSGNPTFETLLRIARDGLSIELSELDKRMETIRDSPRRRRPS
jgi:transcriptional regulator with XRE-family HTH domain